MTNQEAIIQLDYLKDFKTLDQVKALDMAIKALEQESSGDLISRQTDNLCISCTNIGCEFQSGIVRTECAFYMPPHIESDNCGNYVVMQPVNPQEPKIGHWIEEDIFDGDVAYRCSECDELFWLESGTPKDNEYNFCPKCGARMVEPQESEDK